MKNRKTFKELLKDLPELKQLNPQERLPQYFDTMWDIKFADQLIFQLKTTNNPDIYSALARYGYDAKSIKKFVESSILRTIEKKPDLSNNNL